MRIIIDNIPAGRKYGEVAVMLENTMQSGRPVVAGEFSRVDLDDGEATITVDQYSDSEPKPSILPYRVMLDSSTRAAFDNQDAALEFASELLNRVATGERVIIYRSLEAV